MRHLRLIGLVRFLIVGLRSRRAERFTPVRLDLGRFLALGLDTALNYFLGREIKEERAEIDRAAGHLR